LPASGPEIGRHAQSEGDNPNVAPLLALDAGAPNALLPAQLGWNAWHLRASRKGVVSCPSTSRTYLFSPLGGLK
jgi:hypothetical protein